MKELRAELDGIIPTRGSLTDREVQIDIPGAGSKRLLVNARQVISGSRNYPLILLSLRSPA